MGFNNKRKIVVLSVIGLLFFMPILIFKVLHLQVVYNETRSLNGSIFLVQSFTDNQKVLHKGDLILFKHSLFKDRLLLKRVSHLEGEAYKAEKVILETECENPQTRIPKNHVAVTGDHVRSFDSRYKRFGFISKDSILGKAWRVL